MWHLCDITQSPPKPYLSLPYSLCLTLRKEQVCNPGTTLSRAWVEATGLELASLMPGPA